MMDKQTNKHDIRKAGGTERSETERSEVKRSSVPPAADGARDPDPEVSSKIKRRCFSAAYKLKIVREADKCKKHGEIGALLRREGLYSSHLSEWRKLRDQGALNGLKARKRGPRKTEPNPLAARVKQLEKEKTKLEKKLLKAEMVIELQKKMAEILGIPQDRKNGTKMK